MLQQNGHIKRKFATLFNQACAMLNCRKFNTYLSNGLLAKAANTTMLLKNNLLTPNRNLSPFQKFFGKGKRSILSSFGELYIATYRDNTHWAKLANQGTPGIWVGYVESHQMYTAFSTP